MTQPEPGNLDLLTLVNVSPIGLTVDNIFYAYSPHWRWSLIERSKFGSMYADMLAVERKTTPNDKDLQKFVGLQKSIINMVCPDMPDSVITSLPADAQRTAIIIDFLTKSGGQASTLIPKELAAMMTMINTIRTGGESLPGSKQPTAVSRIRGRTSPVRS